MKVDKLEAAVAPSSHGLAEHASPLTRSFPSTACSGSVTGTGVLIYCKGQRVWVQPDETGRGTCSACGQIVAVIW